MFRGHKMFEYKKMDFLKFIIYDYCQARDILKSHFDCGDSDKTAVFVVGANGSGKSTLIANIYEMGILNLPYINADTMALNYNLNDYAVMDKTTDLVKAYISSSKGFIYETVFSHISKLDLIKLAKDNGFKIIIIYVATNNPDINIARVQKRVAQGGHNIPQEKIILRYHRCVQNVESAKSLADQFIEINNSTSL